MLKGNLNDSKNYPLILLIALDDSSQQYYTEILLNEIFDFINQKILSESFGKRKIVFFRKFPDCLHIGEIEHEKLLYMY